jgi:hypothetical protein
VYEISNRYFGMSYSFARKRSGRGYSRRSLMKERVCGAARVAVIPVSPEAPLISPPSACRSPLFSLHLSTPESCVRVSDAVNGDSTVNVQTTGGKAFSRAWR